jgi:hypothetical protein
MQNAWRFVDDAVLRERLKEAKGIGTPATRAEIIGGLKKQAFLMAQGKHIVPTETGLSLFGVLKQADPALVDPGLTAQLECLLDEIVIGKQEMIGAIDAVCDVAQRIIGKLQAFTSHPDGPSCRFTLEPVVRAPVARHDSQDRKRRRRRQASRLHAKLCVSRWNPSVLLGYGRA